MGYQVVSVAAEDHIDHSRQGCGGGIVLKCPQKQNYCDRGCQPGKLFQEELFDRV
jgi:hypothetical protein